MNQTVISVLAHPDDAEFLCAGVLARLAKEHHWHVHIASMTAGDCGSVDLLPRKISRVRKREGAAAAAIIGARYHCLKEKDLRVFYNKRTLTKVTRLLRQVRPGIVLTHSPSDYMLDHEMTSQVVRAAVFAAPAPNFQKGRSTPIALDHIPHLYYCDPIEGKDPMGREVEAAFCVDISNVIETKAEMLAAHASQREWLRSHHGIDQYIQSMRDWSAHRGKQNGTAFAEGFRQHLGHSYPLDNLLEQVLGRLA